MHTRAKLSCAEFLGLVPSRTADSTEVENAHWQLALSQRMSGGRGSLFGGVGLAAGIVALELATGKPVIWATGQYLSLTQIGEQLDLEVILPARGRNVVQGRVVGRVSDHAASESDREVITIIGAAGARPSSGDGCWQKAPSVPPPGQCPIVPERHGNGSVHEHIELRLAAGMFGFSGFGTPSADGRSALWVRMPEVEHDAGALAIIADYMPSVLGNAMGHVMHCTSLDNTIRFAGPTASEWVLCDNRMEFAGNGFGHGSAHLWNERGELLATASQSMIVRAPEPAALTTPDRGKSS